MVAPERAFRALGRAEPQTIASLVEGLAFGVVPGRVRVLPEDVVVTWLDRPLHPIGANSGVQGEPGEVVLRVGGQGYHEDGCGERVFRYRLGLSLRHWARQTLTLEVWLGSLTNEPSEGGLRQDGVDVKGSAAVLRGVDAALLLACRETACFALGANDRRGDEALCHEAVHLLSTPEVSLRCLQHGAAAARAHGPARYDAMLRAMEEQCVEGVIIEDLVKIGEEIAMEKGRQIGVVEGTKKGLLAGLLDLCDVLGLSVDPPRRAELEAMDVPELEAVARRLKATRAW